MTNLARSILGPSCPVKRWKRLLTLLLVSTTAIYLRRYRYEDATGIQQSHFAMYSTLPSILYNDQLFAVCSSYEYFPFNVNRTRDLYKHRSAYSSSRVALGNVGETLLFNIPSLSPALFRKLSNQLISLEADLLAYSDLKFSSLSLSIFPGGPNGCLTGCITVAG